MKLRTGPTASRAEPATLDRQIGAPQNGRRGCPFRESAERVGPIPGFGLSRLRPMTDLQKGNARHQRDTAAIDAPESTDRVTEEGKATSSPPTYTTVCHDILVISPSQCQFIHGDSESRQK